VSLNPNDWIDPQRAAGMNRGNIFNDILAAARERRQARRPLPWSAAGIRERAREHDAMVERRPD